MSPKTKKPDAAEKTESLSTDLLHRVLTKNLSMQRSCYSTKCSFDPLKF